MSCTTIHQAIGYKLLHTASITYIVGTRVYHGNIPEVTITLPTINYFEVSNSNLEVNAERSRWQISCRAKDIAVCRNLAYLVHCAFNNLCETIDGFDLQASYYSGSRVIFEENSVYHYPVDFFFTY